MMKDPIVVRNLEYERLLNEEIEDERQLVKQLKEQLEESKAKEKEAVLNLQKEGWAVSKIAPIFNLSEAEIEKICEQKQ